MHSLPYHTDLKEFSRQLRNNSTLSEVLLWNKLKSAQLGYTFNRQKPLGKYIVDFYCLPLNLVIEIDGNTHQLPNAYLSDMERQEVLEQLGLHFLRFDDLEVKKDIANIVRAIENHILEFEEQFPNIKEKKKWKT